MEKRCTLRQAWVPNALWWTTYVLPAYVWGLIIQVYGGFLWVPELGLMWVEHILCRKLYSAECCRLVYVWCAVWEWIGAAMSGSYRAFVLLSMNSTTFDHVNHYCIFSENNYGLVEGIWIVQKKKSKSVLYNMNETEHHTSQNKGIDNQ